MVELIFKHLGNQLAQGQRIELRSMGSWHVKTRKSNGIRDGTPT